MTKIYNKEGYLLADIFLEKEDVNCWSLVHMDGIGNLIHAWHGMAYWIACETKKEYIKDFKEGLK